MRALLAILAFTLSFAAAKAVAVTLPPTDRLLAILLEDLAAGKRPPKVAPILPLLIASVGPPGRAPLSEGPLAMLADKGPPRLSMFLARAPSGLGGGGGFRGFGPSDDRIAAFRAAKRGPSGAGPRLRDVVLPVASQVPLPSSGFLLLGAGGGAGASIAWGRTCRHRRASGGRLARLS